MIMAKYFLEFILCAQDASCQMIKSSLLEFGENLKITDCDDALAKGKNFKVNIDTQDPTLVFDACAQFGRIKSVRAEEVG